MGSQRIGLRILSLLPAATEMVYALGLGGNLVGVSDDSDFPKIVERIPRVVTTTLPQGLTSRQIDKRVRTAKHRGIGIFHVDEELLKKASPNLVLSQELCEVCAIGTSEIKRAARIIKGPVRTISLEPESYSDILENIRMIGELTDTKKEADKLISNLSKRISTVVKQVNQSSKSVPHVQDKTGIIRYSVRKYLTYFQDGSWQANTNNSPTPAIFFVMANERRRAFVSHYGKAKLAKTFEDISLFLTTQDFIRFSKGKVNIWKKVD